MEPEECARIQELLLVWKGAMREKGYVATIECAPDFSGKAAAKLTIYQQLRPSKDGGPGDGGGVAVLLEVGGRWFAMYPVIADGRCLIVPATK